MVITFNKRELVEFANWNILQERLPQKFKIEVPKGWDINPLYDVLENLGCTKNYRKSDIESVNKESQLIFIEKLSEGSIMCCMTTLRDKADEYPTIPLENIPRMLAYENIPLFTDEDIKYWLKHEKGIEINK